MSSGDWLQTSFTWDPAALDAQPAKPAADKPAAKAAPVCQVRRAAATTAAVAAKSGTRPLHAMQCPTACALQVEGCGVDLTDLRYFFRKQRICGALPSQTAAA